MAFSLKELNDDLSKSSGDPILHLAKALAEATLIQALEREDTRILLRAAESGYDAVVVALLAARPSCINAINSDRATALHLAAQSGHDKIVERLLALASPDLINAIDREGYAALHRAVMYGHDKVVAQLLPRTSANLINSRVGRRCGTALHLAAIYGHDNVVAQVLAASPDLIRARNDFGRTALDLAVMEGDDKVVAQLLAASPSIGDGTEDTFEKELYCVECILHYANSGNVVDRLLAANPGLIDDVDAENNTVLHSAVKNANAIDRDDDSAVKRLLELKPELIHAVKKTKDTPLHAAIDNPSYFRSDRVGLIVERLWRLNPNALRVVNAHGHTPFHIAVRNQNSSLIELWQRSLSLDEIMAAFTTPALPDDLERLRLEVETQCACLSVLLIQDVVSTVYEYLGFVASNQKKRKKHSVEGRMWFEPRPPRRPGARISQPKKPTSCRLLGCAAPREFVVIARRDFLWGERKASTQTAQRAHRHFLS